MKILLTGSSGFIGKELDKFLKNKGCEVFYIVRNKSKKKNYFFFKPSDDESKLNKIIAKIRPKIIFHMAGKISSESLDKSLEANSIYTLKILSTLKNLNLLSKVKILIVGSASEYGFVDKKRMPVNEKENLNPSNIYGLTKYLQYKFFESFLEKNNKIIYVRPFNVFGENMSPELSIGNFAKQLKFIRNKKVKPIIYLRNPSSARDFIYVKDTVKIFWKLINNSNAYGKVFNICTGRSTKVSKILNFMVQKSNLKIKVKIDKNYKETDQQREMSIYYGDNRLLIKTIGKFKFTKWEDVISNML